MAILNVQVWLLVCGLLASLQVLAQPVFKDVEHLDSDRPEAWAMFHYTSVTLLSGFGVSRELAPGAMELGLEVDRVPQLSEAEQRVGFNGTKEEDLNKAPLFARPRLGIGLPGGATLSVSYLPPVRVYGLKPELFAAALEMPVFRGRLWSFGTRVYGQFGSVQGAFTCPDQVTGFAPGSAQNPFGCEQQSTDKAYQRYLGVEFTMERRLKDIEGLSVYIALAGNYLDAKVQVHAQTFGFADRSRLEAQDYTRSLSAGLVYDIDSRLRFAAGALYTPLEITRWPSTSHSNEPLFNLRTMLSYRL